LKLARHGRTVGTKRGRLVKPLRRRVGVNIGVVALDTHTHTLLFSCNLQELLGVEPRGFEPLTSAVQRRRSPN
jgi:hypothetical protein